jgi:predicted metal-dependent hydrolase
MVQLIELNDLVVELSQKKVKNLRLTVHPPQGRVKLSAPLRMPMKTILSFIQAKREWIQQHQKKIQEKNPHPTLQYLDQENHYLWGKNYLLKIVEQPQKPPVDLQAESLQLKIRLNADYKKREAAMDAFYRQQIHHTAPFLIEKWEKIIGVTVSNFTTQKMKSRWGVCTPKKKQIKLNTELAKKPIECLEYVIVHELVHLLEPSHNHRFKGFMDKFLPSWRLQKQLF